MSENKKAGAVNAVAEVKPVAVESVYTAAELANNYKLFNTYREVVVIALKQAGKTKATFSEAKKIIDNFKSRRVK